MLHTVYTQGQTCERDTSALLACAVVSLKLLSLTCSYCLACCVSVHGRAACAEKISMH